MRHIRQFFVFGNYGNYNTGDNAMLYAILDKMHSLLPLWQYAILSNVKVTIPPKLDNLVKYVKPKPYNVFKEIMLSNIFVMGGGTQVFDSGNKKRRFLVLSQILTLFLWAKLLRKKVLLVNIGIEPPSTKWGKILTLMICKLSDYISVRDSISYDLVKSFKYKNILEHTFDISIILQNNLDLLRSNDNDVNILGISLLPYFEIYKSKKSKDIIFVNEIAKGLNLWLRQNENNYIYIFVMSETSAVNDIGISNLLKSKLDNLSRVKIIAYNPNPLITIELISECKAFIGMRYHSCIFAYITNIPMIIIDYATKCSALITDIMLNENSLISIEDILNGNFPIRMEHYIRNYTDYCAKLPVWQACKIIRDTMNNIKIIVGD